MDEPISDDNTLVFQFSNAWQSHLIRIMTNSLFSHVDLVASKVEAAP